MINLQAIDAAVCVSLRIANITLLSLVTPPLNNNYKYTDTYIQHTYIIHTYIHTYIHT